MSSLISRDPPCISHSYLRHKDADGEERAVEDKTDDVCGEEACSEEEHIEIQLLA